MTVKSIAEILAGPKISNYHGSEKTKEMVAQQIRERWGDSELLNYSAETSALPYSKWISLGYRPKKGSKALKSITIVDKRDPQGNIIKSYRKNINLFYYRSVEPVTPQQPC
jgi:hypothetical protein